MSVSFTGPYVSTPAVLAAMAPVRRALKVMCIGDSLTTVGIPASGPAGVDDRAAMWRSWFDDFMREQRVDVTYLGQFVNGPMADVSSGWAPPGLARLRSWRHCAVGGKTIADLMPYAATAEATYGAADLYVIQLVTNNFNAGNPHATTVAQALLDIQAIVAARVAANPKCIVLVGDGPPCGPPYPAYAARQANINAYNAGLVAALAKYPQAVVVPTGSLLTRAHLFDEVHPNPIGCAIIGRAFADAALRVINVGPAQPRRLHDRSTRSALVLPCASGSVGRISDVDGTHQILPGATAWSFGFTFRPTDLSTTSEILAFLGGQDGSSLAQGIMVSAESDGIATYGATSIMVSYWLAGVQGSFLNTWNDALRVGKLHQITVTYDPSDGCLCVYCLREGDDGFPESSLVSQTLAVAAPPALYPLAFGSFNLGNFPAVGVPVPGHRRDLWIAKGTAIAADQLDLAWDEGSIPSGATAYYPLDDNAPSGGAFLPCASWNAATSAITDPEPNGVLGSGATSTWLAPGALPEPWDRTRPRVRGIVIAMTDAAPAAAGCTNNATMAQGAIDFVECTGALGADRALMLASEVGHVITIKNATTGGKNVVATHVLGGATVNCAAGASRVVWDGTNLVAA